MTTTPAEVFPPGEYLRDELEERGWTQTELAAIMGRPVQVISEIVTGKKEITTETALALGEALGTSAELWLNLQTAYRLHEAKGPGSGPVGSGSVARKARLRSLIPLAAARKRGWLPDTEDVDLLEAKVRELFEIDTLDEQPAFAMAARRAGASEADRVRQVAWLAHVRSVAVTRDAAGWDRDGLVEVASRIPRLTRGGVDRLTEVPSLLAGCGVVLVVSPGLPGGKLDGAVTGLGDGRRVIGLTARNNRFDGFVFTLLHECAHLALGHITPESPALVDDEGTPGDGREGEADALAAEWLFPEGFEVPARSRKAVEAAAERHGVDPSLVIGQVQRALGDWSFLRRDVPGVLDRLEVAGMVD